MLGECISQYLGVLFRRPDFVRPGGRKVGAPQTTHSPSPTGCDMSPNTALSSSDNGGRVTPSGSPNDTSSPLMETSPKDTGLGSGEGVSGSHSLPVDI